MRAEINGREITPAGVYYSVPPPMLAGLRLVQPLDQPLYRRINIHVALDQHLASVGLWQMRQALPASVTRRSSRQAKATHRPQTYQHAIPSMPQANQTLPPPSSTTA